jgi:hypothetical protein
MEAAARSGDVDELKRLYHQNGYRMSYRVLVAAAEGNSHSCLDFALANGSRFMDALHFFDLATTAASRFGHLDMLKRLHSLGCPWDATTTVAAAANGHLECLKYAIKKGCRLTNQAALVSAKNQHLNCYRFLLEMGCTIKLTKAN